MLTVRFLFLGTGTSAGIPAIGCSCPVCTSTDPRDQRLRTSAAVQFKDPRGEDRTILLDAGPDLRQQALRARQGELAAHSIRLIVMSSSFWRSWSSHCWRHDP